MRAVLQNTYKRHRENGPYHGFPEEWQWDKPVFTVLRHPAYWLRSMWAHQLRGGWQPGRSDSLYWNDWTRLMLDFQCDEFEGFVDNLYNRFEGIVTWYHGIFLLPNMWVFKLHSLELMLTSAFPETGEVYYSKAVQDIRAGCAGVDLPEISSKVMSKIEHKERFYFQRYGQFAEI